MPRLSKFSRGKLKGLRIWLYSLDAKRRKQLFSGRVWRHPYPLVEVEVNHGDVPLFQLDGFSRPGRAPDHVMMSPEIEVDIFA
jgi:uncharacterized protein